MAIVKPFIAVRPKEEYASRVAALPYDVYNREEAKVVAQKEELSFLRIDRAETQFPDVANNLLPAMPCSRICKEGFLASQKGLEARLAPGSGRSPA